MKKTPVANRPNRGVSVIGSVRGPAVLAALAGILAGGVAPAATSAVSGSPELRTNQPGQMRSDARPAQSQASASSAATLFSGYTPGSMGVMTSGGVPPKVWGMSAACARMARKSRLRAAGVGGQRQ